LGKYSKDLFNRISTRGPEKGYCVICGDYGALTRDHVPPKGCNNLDDRSIRSWVCHFTGQGPVTYSQKGTHYKTICGYCNNTRLGSEYDPALVEISNEITEIIKLAATSKIEFPETIDRDVKTQRVAKSLVGHILAGASISEVSAPPKSAEVLDAFREYVLSPSKPMPDKLEIYYWTYPYKKQVLVRFFSKTRLNAKYAILGSVLKFHPFGFWLVWDKPKGFKINLPILVRDKSNTEECRKLRFELSNGFPHDFPEAPQSDEVTMIDKDMAVVSEPKK
jgi:hypothetical protein